MQTLSLLFQESTHGEQFRQDLTQNIERNVGLDTIMRLRTSTGEVLRYLLHSGEKDSNWAFAVFFHTRSACTTD